MIIFMTICFDQYDIRKYYFISHYVHHDVNQNNTFVNVFVFSL
jgi:hypothetical protein